MQISEFCMAVCGTSSFAEREVTMSVNHLAAAGHSAPA
jgi:hypothetical protein